MVRGDFSNPVSTLDVLTKDIKLGLALGQSVNANMPLGELCAPFFTEGQELGFGSLDSAAVYKVFEAREGVIESPDCSKRDYSGADTNNGRTHGSAPTARATREGVRPYDYSSFPPGGPVPSFSSRSTHALK